MTSEKYTFDLIYPRYSADMFSTQEEAQEVADEIRESQVMCRLDRKEDGYVIQVGPWMFAKCIKEKVKNGS